MSNIISNTVKNKPNKKINTVKKGNNKDIKEKFFPNSFQKVFHAFANRAGKYVRHMSAVRFIVLGYVAIVVVGALLLSLPISSATGEWTSYTDCIFTATSATCVTGLIRFDTATHWSLFGQILIITMIQIGGVGFMSIAMMILILSKRRIGLSSRTLMQDSVSAPQLGGIVKMTKFIISGTLLIEGIGAFLLCFDFVPRFGRGRGLYYSIFHSISAFCNGGFDLMGPITGPCSSLVGFESNLYVNIVISLLVVIGGLGFFVWRDLIDKRFVWKKLALQSKIVLTVSAGLLILGTVFLCITEWNGIMYEGYKSSTKVLSCFFQSMSARTAGFNTADLSKMTEPGLLVMIFLMLIGGSTGSTAGGMKTTTFWVLILSIFATYGRKKNIEAFGRRVDESLIRTASCIFMTYLTMILTSAVIISYIEKLPMMTVLFETTSAMATVGITLGITGSLGMVSKMIIAFLMLCGRVGSITMLLAFSSEKRFTSSRLAEEHVQIG